MTLLLRDRPVAWCLFASCSHLAAELVLTTMKRSLKMNLFPALKLLDHFAQQFVWLKNLLKIFHPATSGT